MSAETHEVRLCTLKRGITYLRALGAMNKRDHEIVSSEELANFLCLNDATVRRDLSAFGKLGTRGLGYRVGDLRTRLLEMARPARIVYGAVAGVGRLGEALLGHGGLLRVPSLVILVAFDVDVQKIGSMVGNVRILDACEMVDIVRRERIAVGIVTVPPEAAQGVVDRLVEGGVSGILNFAATNVIATPGVVVSNIDISLELESLLLSLRERDRDQYPGGSARTSGSSI